MTKHYIIPIFVPHYGCPHDCVFCNQRKITGVNSGITEEEVEKIIDDHLATFKKDSFIEVAFFGGSFTAINISEQKALLKIPFKYKQKGLIDEIRLSTRPDAIDLDILEMLKTFTVDTIELGVQSLDIDVLEQSERGHNDNVVYESSKLIKENGFNLGLQMMLGLPCDTKEKSLLTAKKLLQIGPSFIRIYPTLVIKNTKLEFLMNNNLYTPISIEDTIDISAKILMLFTANNIPVIRIGLQTTENIQLGKDVVGGPFHPALRQLVEEKIFKTLFLDYIKAEKIDLRSKNITITCSNLYASVIAGQKGKNKREITEELGIGKISIFAENIDKYLIKLKVDESEFSIDLIQKMKDYIDKYLF